VRIWLQKHTVAGRVPALDACYDRLVGIAADLGAELDIHTLPAEVYDADVPAGFVRHGAIEEHFSWWFARQAVEAERQGYDVFLLTVSQDPGLRLARHLTGIPCIGYGETSLRLAQQLTDRIGVVGFIPELQVPIEENFRRYGLGDAQVTFSYLGIDGAAIARAFEGDDAEFRAAFTAAAERCLSAGCEVIIPGEGLPNELLVRAGISRIDGAAVIDSDAAAVHMAVTVGRLAASGAVVRPTRGYWNDRPVPDVMDHVRRVLGT
jgi:allantoin racemase